MAGLVDTNILVYRFDPRDPFKQHRANQFLRSGVELRSLVLPHQALVELMAALIRPRADLDNKGLRDAVQAAQDVQELLSEYPIAYPDARVVDIALYGHATFGLSWFDAHLWAYAERYGYSPLWSEDFQHGRVYGSVRVLDPFRVDEVNEPPAASAYL